MEQRPPTPALPANGWTGGQYSVFRMILGSTLAVGFAHRLLADVGPTMERIAGNMPIFAASRPAAILMLGAATALSVLLAVGWQDRLAALILVFLGLILGGPLLTPDGIALAWLLLAHCLLPVAPYGSLAAIGRLDPGNSWHFPDAVFTGCWIVLGIVCSLTACILQRNVFTLAPGAVIILLSMAGRCRPWLWGGILLAALWLIAARDHAVPIGLILLLLSCFDPGWIKPVEAANEAIFYDGECGLCHRWVRFVLAEDRTGSTFRFAPLDSDAFRNAVSDDQRANLPDSVAVQTADGRLLVRSAAVRYIMRRLGGWWRVVAGVLTVVPTPLLDLGYDGIARIRHRLFAKPEGLCPILPASLRDRFDY